MRGKEVDVDYFYLTCHIYRGIITLFFYHSPWKGSKIHLIDIGFSPFKTKTLIKLVGFYT